MTATCTPIPKPGKAKRRRVDPLHREATKLAAASDCLLCGRTGCAPCHWPKHRGMGGANAGWERTEWVPLCPFHHDLIDRRLGVSAAVEARRIAALRLLEQRAAKWWTVG